MIANKPKIDHRSTARIAFFLMIGPQPLGLRRGDLGTLAIRGCGVLAARSGDQL